jgi:ribosomal protein S18 acetylase RimI-like enzyme
MKVKIRKVRFEEINQLAELGKTTFEEAFSESNDPDDMQLYLQQSFNQEKIKNEFNTENSAFYFAEKNKEIAGYLKINLKDAQNEDFKQDWMEIERVYVLRNFQGQGIGKSLIDFALELAQKRNLKFAWLGVWENNLPAIFFYKKLGFESFSKHTFVLGKDPQTDILMRIKVENYQKT